LGMLAGDNYVKSIADFLVHEGSTIAKVALYFGYQAEISP